MYTPRSPHRHPTSRAATRPCTKNWYCSGSMKNAIGYSPRTMGQSSLLGHVGMGQGAIGDKRHAVLTQHHHVRIVRLTQDIWGEHGLRRALGNDTVLKADNPWDMTGNSIEVVRGQEDRHALSVEFVQEVQNIMLRLQIHASSGFIEQQELRFSHQGSGEEDTLLLSARELTNMPPGIGCKPKAIEQGGDLPAVGTCGPGPVAGVPIPSHEHHLFGGHRKAPVNHLALWHITHGHLRQTLHVPTRAG